MGNTTDLRIFVFLFVRRAEGLENDPGGGMGTESDWDVLYEVPK